MDVNGNQLICYLACSVGILSSLAKNVWRINYPNLHVLITWESGEEMPSDFYAHVFTGKSVCFNQFLSEVA